MPIMNKILSLPALLRKLPALRRQGKTIAFTNGCFDLLHKGHVLYLEQARKLGDILVVAINGDDSVRRLKGPSRPINTLADRMEVMAGLQSVDFVTWFDEDTPLAIIETLRPDVLVKGGDWKSDQIVGSAEVRSWGGKVRSLKYVPGKSTTEMIERAKSL